MENRDNRRRILIVDDHPAFRLGLISMVDDVEGLQVIAHTGTACEALKLVHRHRPDIVLLDLRLPDMSGVEMIQRLRQDSPNCRVIVVTTCDSDEDIYRALQAGAKSYLLKDMMADELISTVRAVCAGETPLPPMVAQRLAARLSGPQFTLRETEILRLLARGYNNKEIASACNIATDTVKTHLKKLFAKLRVKGRTQAALAALQLRIATLD